jgi:patatin-related protein
MHGITKELHRAIRASVLEERHATSDGEPASERTYRGLLKALREDRSVHTRIVVDTIAGSSAGGINGIFLAKALAHNLSQDALRDLWFEHGDLEKIIRKPERMGHRLAALLAKAIPLGNDKNVPTGSARRKLFVAALRVYANPLLDGDEMTRRIYEALAQMDPPDAAPPPEPKSLMPTRHLLELAVTVTDHYGYERQLPITDPPIVREAQHRHLLEFSYRSDQPSDFTAAENGALTLAARATSSLPVGFQPVHVGSFPALLPPGATTPEAIQRFFRAYDLAGEQPGAAHLVDGGVLDNRPFGPVLRAIKQRHAASEVNRYLIFLEPDPKAPAKPAGQSVAPTPIPALLGALSGLPRSEPVLDELHDVLERNEQVRAVRDAIEANWAPIETRVMELIPQLDDPPRDPSDPQLKEWSEGTHRAAISLGTLGYPIYVRLKVSSAIDSFATAACLVCNYTNASNQAFLVHSIIREWARHQDLFEHEHSPTEKQLAFIRAFDLDYAQRRLHFVIAGVSWLYRDVSTQASPSRRELDAVKERLYEAVAKLEWLDSGRGFGDEVLGGVRTCFGEQRIREYLELHGFDTAAFLNDHGDEFGELNAALRNFLADQLQDFTPDLYRDLIELTAHWPKKPRRDLLIRYLAFPIWDSLLYPLQALSDVAERDTVRVARLSPQDSTLLTPLNKGMKVQGARLGHAYAFFSRKARENDYLWGRLDAAERIVRLLLTETKMQNGMEITIGGDSHPDYRHWCNQAFLAILEEDGMRLPTIKHDIETIRRQITPQHGSPTTLNQSR